MAQFMYHVGYTPDAWKTLVQNPQNRLELIRPVIKELGGSLEHGWFTFGDYDVVVIVDLPDNVSAAAFSIAVAAGGSVRSIKTTPLLSVEDGVKAMQRAGDTGYKPPAAR